MSTALQVVTGADNDPSDATVTIDATTESVSGSPIEAVRFPDIAPYEDSYTVLLQSGANPLLPTSEIRVQMHHIGYILPTTVVRTHLAVRWWKN